MISYGNSSAWKRKKAFKFRLFFDKKKKKILLEFVGAL